jgi:hypothetical protein
MGFCGPNLLRAAVTGERPETLPSPKVSKWRYLLVPIDETIGNIPPISAIGGGQLIEFTLGRDPGPKVNAAKRENTRRAIIRSLASQLRSSPYCST